MFESAGAAWAQRLMPDHIDAALRQPADALLVYQRLRWRIADAGDAQLRAGVAWERKHGEGVERGLWSEASVGETTAADAAFVVVHEGHAVPRGSAVVPPAPDPPAEPVHDPLVVSEDEVHAFVADVDGHYPATETMTAAHQRGFAGMLVPGTLLLIAAVARALRADHGEVEAWFRGPVPAGAILTRRRSDDGVTQALHLAGRSRPSVLLRVASVDNQAVFG